jgi:AcrR family transcriptional regulator
MMREHPQAAPTEQPLRRSDGERTHEAILDAAMRLASIEGLGSVTMGRIARELAISKSGVFAHFGSVGRLQQETIDAAEEVFNREVIESALEAPDGLPRLEALCESYLSYVERGVFPGGCFFAQLLGEYDAQEGEIHARVEKGQRGFLGLLAGLVETAQQREELAISIDASQMAFELYAPLELANFLSTLYRDPQVIDQARHTVRTTIAAARRGPHG